jgi:hypothetical protein
MKKISSFPVHKEFRERGEIYLIKNIFLGLDSDK